MAYLPQTVFKKKIIEIIVTYCRLPNTHLLMASSNVFGFSYHTTNHPNVKETKKTTEDMNLLLN